MAEASPHSPVARPQGESIFGKDVNFQQVLDAPSTRADLVRRARRRNKKIKKKRGKKPYAAVNPTKTKCSTPSMPAQPIRDKIEEGFRFSHTHKHAKLHSTVTSHLAGTAEKLSDSIEDCTSHVTSVVFKNRRETTSLWGEMRMCVRDGCGYITGDDAFSIYSHSQFVNSSSQTRTSLHELVYTRSEDSSTVLFSRPSEWDLIGKIGHEPQKEVQKLPGADLEETECTDEEQEKVDALLKRAMDMMMKENKYMSLGLYLGDSCIQVLEPYCRYAVKSGAIPSLSGAASFTGVKLVPVTIDKKKYPVLCIVRPALIDLLYIVLHVWPGQHFWLCMQTQSLCVVLGEEEDETMIE